MAGEQVLKIAIHYLSNHTHLPSTSPRCEPPHLPVVSIKCGSHLRAYQEDLTVIEQYSTVVADIFMHYRPREGGREGGRE